MHETKDKQVKRLSVRKRQRQGTSSPRINTELAADIARIRQTIKMDPSGEDAKVLKLPEYNPGS